MNIFDLLIVQPIFNLLLFIYNFVGDFGVAIIILTIIIRFLLLPMVRKQLRQTKLMRQIQPELKRIKKQANGDRMQESQLMMALYKEKGIKPMSSLMVLIVQLPIFMAVFWVIRNWDNYLDNFTYPFLQGFMNIPNIVAEHTTPLLFGVVDLSRWPLHDGVIEWALIVLALLAAGLQFFQTRQITPTGEKSKRKKLKEYFAEAAAGKEVDQSEMTANMTKNMMYFFPIMTFFIAINLPGAVVLYYAVQAGVAVVQQHFILNRDREELEKIADQPSQKRLKNATEAEIITRPAREVVNKNKAKSGGATVVRRIKAK
ncbi:MAG: YidC/Oxa1 family membrane protein insertase [Candidatus Nomurabacteria bacterium]|jgi:YidC/Oxa1 family membrane protein insertase|nr:YidC/Oxa1 family membrane protein insertase [Candidatus Nomurabacteria bacterium]